MRKHVSPTQEMHLLRRAAAIALLAVVSLVVVQLLLGSRDSTRLPSSALSIPSEAKSVSFAAQFDSFEWDTVYVFPGYVSRGDIRAALAYGWRQLDRLPEEVPEGHFWVMFVHDGAVVRWMDIEWPLDLSELDDQAGIPREQAIFVVNRSGGVIGLEP